MASKFTIGIQFNLDPGWMGGAYYLQNLLAALGTLDRALQPEVVIITHEKSSYDFLRQSGYDRMSYCTGDQVMQDRNHRGIDLLFPYPLGDSGLPTLAWIPDFQEKHLPYLFTVDEIAGRKREHESYFTREGLLLSSESALADYHRFYPGYSVPTFVVPFATFLPEHLPDSRAVRQRHGLPERYFFAPNQFWIHKNHIVVLAALRELKRRGIKPVVCFSGKEVDSRADGYAPFLRQKITEWELGDQIRFLGFMPREDQAVTIREAVAILQPSRFEGWSTVVEDAKALNQYVIASSLDVHREQLECNADFFDPSDFMRLADLLEQHWKTAPERELSDYRRNQREYGERLIGVFRAVIMANQRSGQPGPSKIRSEISHSIDDADIIGLSPLVEGPDEGLGIAGKFRWMDGKQLMICRDALTAAAPVLKIRFRNGVKGQRLTLRAGTKVIRDGFVIEDDDLATPLELLVDLSDHVGTDIRLDVDQLQPAGFRQLGLLVEAVDFVAVNKN